MRDHPNHDVPILGGLWGLKMTSDMKSQMKTSFDQMFKHSTNLYGKRTESQHDQIALRKFIW